MSAHPGMVVWLQLLWKRNGRKLFEAENAPSVTGDKVRAFVAPLANSHPVANRFKRKYWDALSEDGKTAALLEGFPEKTYSFPRVDPDVPGDFEYTADKFIEMVQSTEIGPSTDVDVIYYCVDENGAPIPPFRSSMVPTTTVKADPEFANARAKALHLDTIIANINSLVRTATRNKFAAPPDAPVNAKVLDGMELEIIDP